MSVEHQHTRPVYEIYAPALPLRNYISHFTYYRNHTPGHRMDRFLPNGNIEIVIDLTETPKFIYDNIYLTEIQACHKLWVSGIRNKYITIPSGLDAEMFVLNFCKGKARAFLGMPLSEITDTVIDGDLVLKKIFLSLREQLLVHHTVEKKFQVAEQMLTSYFSHRLCSNPVIEYSLNKILASPEIVVIKNLVAKTGYSPKHLIHLFEQNVGVSPKSFLRIIRFQKSIREIETKGETNFACLASDCGYYDQSHFIADFKSFSGFTPVEYMTRKSNYLNYVPVR